MYFETMQPAFPAMPKMTPSIPRPGHTCAVSAVGTNRAAAGVTGDVVLANARVRDPKQAAPPRGVFR